MPIFVAKNYEGKTESIVLSKNKDMANAYWQGLGINAHSVREFSEEDLDDHPTGVLPILKTSEWSGYDLSRVNPSDTRYLLVAK